MGRRSAPRARPLPEYEQRAGPAALEPFDSDWELPASLVRLFDTDSPQ